jgi:putative heme iron utilization protein
MDQNALALLGRLLHTRRVTALGTNHDGYPFVSMVLTVVDPDGPAFYMLASRLAWHTKDFLNDPRVSLMMTEEEDPGKDPQSLARVSVMGTVSALEPDDAAYPAARVLYLGAFPTAETYFQLGDFSLYRITPISGRFVGGFARAMTISPEDLRQAARLSGTA